MKITYNAPVSLTFALLCLAVLILGILTNNASTNLLFKVGGSMNVSNVFDWLKLVGHVFGHSGWEHLMGNMAFILLLGPILEEKYGGRFIIITILITAVVTAVLNILLFQTSLMGASGIVFMFIILSSFNNISDGELPLTFILVVALFLAKEIFDSFKNDTISQFAHLTGGALGGVFGFIIPKRKDVK